MSEKETVSYNIILESEPTTIVSEYKPVYQARSRYQSEAELEEAMLGELEAQGYEFLDIHTSDDLKRNLRKCLEELNDFKFTNNEWEHFFKGVIANANSNIESKTEMLQSGDTKQLLRRDDGSSKNITLIDKKHIHKNKLQVIHQYETIGNFKNRYDVTILVNGLPLVHCELKRRGVPIKEAFNQIERYQRDSFWADSGLYEYIQIFVISNGTFTKYYSNTTRFNVVSEHNGKRKAQKVGSSSFEFTSFWADAKNNTILDLIDFTRTFFAKHTILKVLTSFCVFTVNKTLLVMRPYQIAATERILNQVMLAENYKRWGTIDAGGFIWHTTGSGKTLTSFKTAQLVSKLPYVDKVMFVVDRQDLDYQTMCEYERFEQGAANASRNTEKLRKNLEDDEKKIVVTTIQKLHLFIKKYNDHPIYAKKCVIIFDECHRSQFGEMHLDIVHKFKKYALFGFTGTPIVAVNANVNTGSRRISDASRAFSKQATNGNFKTTEQVFGKRLHVYTILDAINDKNVLPFKVDYVNTIKDNKGDNSLIEAIDDEKLVLAPKRVQGIVRYILEHYNQKTLKAGPFFEFNKIVDIGKAVEDYNKATRTDGKFKKAETISQKRQGFNSIFAVSSIKAAKVFYEELKRQIAKTPQSRNLKVALIYSYGVNNKQGSDYVLEEDSDSTEALNVEDQTFLQEAINDYNALFNTQYSTSGALFPNYYKDLSMRVKNGDVDILLVVNMFLTGFDATGLNTLWVDKNLKLHGLIQAFSRTNRILNSVKTYGNIVCFRNLQHEVDEAVSLFGDKDAKGIVILKSYKEYYNGYHDGEKYRKGYKELLDELYEKYPLPLTLVGEKEKKGFIKLFGLILRLLNILRSFDEFPGNEIFTEADLQDYLSYYGELYDEFKVHIVKDDVTNDVVFEMELVKQIVVDIDYILELIKKYHDKHAINKEVPSEIARAISSNPELKPKKELIELFIQTLNTDSNITEDWEAFKNEQKEVELKAFIKEERLKENDFRELVDKIFRLGECNPSESDLSRILPNISFFAKGNARFETKRRVLEKLKAFFEKFF